VSLAETLSVIMVLATFATILAGFPVAFTLAGVALIFAGMASLFDVFNPALFGALPSRIFGNAMTSEVLLAVPLFIFMGLALERSRIAEDLMMALSRLFGSRPGGLGYAVFAVGALLAASTGIVGATVVTMGLIALPVMLRAGYRPSLAAGSIAASGTLGQIIPPSIVLIILGDQLANSYAEAQRAIGNWAPEPLTVGDLFAGSLLPGLALVGLYAIYLAVTTRIRPEDAPATHADGDAGADAPPIATVLVAPGLLIVGVLGSILGGVATPTEAASIGAVGAVLLAANRLDVVSGRAARLALGAFAVIVAAVSVADLRIARDTIPPFDAVMIVVAALACAVLAGAILRSILVLHRERVDDGGTRVLADIMRGTTRMTAMVFTILIGASVFALVFRGLGGDRLVGDVLGALPGGSAAVVLVVMLVVFVLGFFLDFIEITFVVIPIVSPVLFAMGVDPVWFGVMIAINLQTSFLTPPFGFALFYLRGVAPASLSTADIYRGVVPFIALQVAMLGILALVPELATWLPELIYAGR